MLEKGSKELNESTDPNLFIPPPGLGTGVGY